MDSEEMSDKTHIMVIPFPLQGHINPMLQFSKRLASKGLRVTLVISATTNTISMPTSINIEHIHFAYEQERDKPDPIDGYLQHFKRVVWEILPELIEKQNTRGYPIKTLVYDSTIPWALDLAHQQGLLGASFFTQSCVVCAIYHYMHEGVLKIPEEGCTLSLPSVSLLGINDLPSFICDMGSYPSLLRLVVNQFSNFLKADWLLFNTYDKLEDEVTKYKFYFKK